MNDRQGKILRIVSIVFLGLTTVMNLAGGIGTVCAAFFTRDYPPFWDILDYQWLYQTIMILTILIGITMAWTTFALFRGGKNVYRNALIILVIGSIVAGVQMFASLILLGKAVPANVKFYINLGTLLYFLALSTPALRGRVNFEQPGDKTDMTAAGGLAAIVAGLSLLTIMLWAGPSHAYEGTNWINVLQNPAHLAGTILIIGGLGALIKSLISMTTMTESQTVSNNIG